MGYYTITKWTTRSNTYAIIFVNYHYTDGINVAPGADEVRLQKIIVEYS
jgi:hypothetical protein